MLIGTKLMFGTSDLLVLIVSFGAACFTLSLYKAAGLSDRLTVQVETESSN